MEKIRILIVEDDMVTAANISLQLIKLGYEITGIETRGEEAIHHAIDNNPDLILMDIRLKGALDGINTAKAIQKKKNIPIIYLSENVDEATFVLAKETNPYAFFAKPFNMVDLERSIALAINQILDKTVEVSKKETIDFLEDRIFIRNQNKLIKIMLAEICYIEAERNYCKIVTLTQTYTIVCILGQLSEKLSNPNFIRIHRSYIINITHMDAVADGHLEIGRKIVPISKAYKNQLFLRIHKV